MAWNLEKDWELTKKNMARIGENFMLSRMSQTDNAHMAEIVNRYRREEAAWYQGDAGENAFSTVSQSFWYAHYLNRKRLKSLGVSVQYAEIGQTPSVCDKDRQYPFWDYYREGKNRVCCLQDITRTTKNYIRSGQILFTEKPALMQKKYFYITTAKEADGKYICPNCGIVSTLDDLIDGCDYCNTKFTLTDFDSKVTSVYFANGFLKERAGGLLWNVSFLLGLGEEKAKDGALPIVHIREDDPQFSEEKFIAGLTNKILSIHYAQSMDEVRPFVKKDISGLIKQCSHVMDVRVTECLLLDYRKDQENQYIDALVKMRLLSCEPNGVREVQTELKLQLVRSIRAIKENCSEVMMFRCRNCGASISLLNGGRCEYCESTLDLKEYDWVINNVEIPKK